MSIGSLSGLPASAAGTSLAQTRGGEVERTQHDAGAQQRRAQNEARAEAAAGIGQTDGENHETGERDADGRRPWEIARHASSDASPPPDVETPPRDPTGQSGTLLDLTG